MRYEHTISRWSLESAPSRIWRWIVGPRWSVSNTVGAYAEFAEGSTVFYQHDANDIIILSLTPTHLPVEPPA
jgi:hypothetical protein